MSYDKDVYWVEPPSDDRDWGDLNPAEIKDRMTSINKYTESTRLNNLIGSL
jgi:hypothetical protein